MLCSKFRRRNPWRIPFILLLAIGSIFSLLGYHLLPGKSSKNFGKLKKLKSHDTFKSFRQWKWRSFMNWKEVEFCRRVEQASKPTNLPQLPPEEFYIRMLTARSPPRGDPFDPPINATELRAKLNLLWKFLDACEQHNITVMMYGGTLLGSYRHHGVIPWDDDEDVLVDSNHKSCLKKVLKRTSPIMALRNADFRVKMEKGANAVWRVSNKSACLHKSQLGCWPFIDVAFFKLKRGWVRDLTTPSHRFPADATFPLHKRPFMGRWVNSPKDALRFLSRAYAPSDRCVSLHFSHKLGVILKTRPKKIRCRKLASTYPFVFRTSDSATSGGGVLETMISPGDAPLYTVPVSEPMGAVNAMYSISQLKALKKRTGK